MDLLLYLVPVVGVLALCVAAALAAGISKKDAGTDKMKELASYIQEGAMAFLMSEYKWIAIFVVVLFVVITLALNIATAVCFVCGAVFRRWQAFSVCAWQRKQTSERRPRRARAGSAALCRSLLTAAP
jgi:K(+)-stimulated pyrophosphate-energized sodium pump